mmetsp:Transcript_1512/g.6756  ORF Transcript_1512/g.6756 Transcript_1512/m.6756 type:complete len:96 (+) Transcript_1512:2213-2500(+)
MAQRQLHEFSNLCHLLSHTADIIITDFIEPLLIFSIDWLAFTENFGIGGNDAILSRICFDNLKLHAPHASTSEKRISFSDRTVCLEKIWFQVNVK